jgi:hypothetical protein
MGRTVVGYGYIARFAGGSWHGFPLFWLFPNTERIEQDALLRLLGDTRAPPEV